jgi:hypothetical protein
MNARRLLTLLSLYAIALLPCVAAASAEFPTELKLTNGAVLHKASADRWTSEYVVVRHVGGIDRIRYTNIAEPQRQVVLGLKTEQIAHAQSASPGTSESKTNGITYSGQVFVQTVGAGSYKFGDADVYAFPLEALSAFETNLSPVDLPAPIAKATTDADGKFTMIVPLDRPHFLFCQATRLAGSHYEYDEWHAPAKDIKDPGRVLLSSEFQTPYHKVRIAQ